MTNSTKSPWIKSIYVMVKDFPFHREKVDLVDVSCIKVTYHKHLQKLLSEDLLLTPMLMDW